MPATFWKTSFQRECRGFAWPCGQYTATTAQALHDAGFAYGRTVENTANVAACSDWMLLRPSCHFQDPNFWNIYEQAKETGIFYFWGHSYEMFEYDPLWQQTEDKIRVISNDPDAVWADVIDIIPGSQVNKPTTTP